VDRAQARMLQPLKPADRKTLLALLGNWSISTTKRHGAAARRRRPRTFGEGELMAEAGARPVLIAGGGIGGLAVALGLAQKGIASILLEKAAALGEIGAGIQLGPNAFHAFDYLGSARPRAAWRSMSISSG